MMLPMYAVLYFPGFPLQAVLRHEPGAWHRPVALVDSGMATPRVVEATASARAAGVALGSTAPQVLARCRTATVRSRNPAQETLAADAILQAAFGFSPNLEATAPGWITLDLRGLAALRPAGAAVGGGLEGVGDREIEAWGTKLREAMESLGFRVRVGVGPTPNVARHAARWGRAGGAGTSDEGGVEVVRDPATFVAGLPVEALEPSSDVASVLRAWGLGTVGEVLALGLAPLAERLGLEALGLFAAASVTTSRPLKTAKPVERFEESHEFEVEIETVEPLLFLLRRFAESLARRLEGFGWVAGVLELRLRLESGRVLEQALRVPQPTRRAEVLFRMLHTHLESLRTESPVKAVGLIVEPTRPEQRQLGLFESALRDPNQFQETLARLAALVGADRVGTPVREDSHRPDAFVLVPPEFDGPSVSGQGGEPDWHRALPTRRRRPAVATQVIWDPEPGKVPATRMGTGGEGGGAGIGDARPIAVRGAAGTGRVVGAAGPWRASGHWWDAGAWERESWDVALTDGRVLRLTRGAEGWSVEAELD